MKPGLSVEDILRLVVPSDVRVSSRGDLAFIASRSDLDKNKNYTEIHVVRRDGSRSFLVGEGDSKPRWSLDGGLLAFTSRRGMGKDEKGVGVFLWGGVGEPRRIALFKHGVRHLSWLDGSSLLVAAPMPREGFYDDEGDYVITDRLPLWFDREGLIAGLGHELLVLDTWSGRTKRLAFSENGVWAVENCGGDVYYAEPIDWRDPTMHRIIRVKASKSPEEMLRGYSVSMLRCIGGRLYALMHRGEIGIASHHKLWLIGSEPECLTCGVLDRNIRSIAGGLEDKPLIIYEDAGAGILAMVSEGEVVPLTGPREYVHEAHAGAGLVGFIASSPILPPEVYLAVDGDRREVTRFNYWVVEERRLAAPKHLEIDSEGDRVEGWVMLPEEEGRHPLILYVHGGPKGMYGYFFHPEMQLMVSQGFAVAYANPRGSTGYSEEFADIRGKYGDTDYEQLMVFLDKVLEEYGDRIDEERLAVTGISYGGYMTNVIITKTGRFKAAVSENGIGDWIADYWASDIGYWFDPDQIGGTPHDNLERYLEKSPAFHADHVETPVLFIHSMEDYRCFIDQALSMHVSLAIRGKDSTLLVFTKGSHGHSRLAEPRHRRKRYEYKVRWLREKLGLRQKLGARSNAEG